MARSTTPASSSQSWRRPERFAVIFDRYFAEVHRYIERRLGTDMADDLASDTFVAAFQKRETYDHGRPNARPWLYGIATNLIGKHRRRQAAAFRAYQRVAVEEASDGHEDGATARVNAQQLSADLARALRRLSKGETRRPVAGGARRPDQ
jgi:RNA polymerase sigma-70 factor (ECF subfamily)